MIGSIVSRPLQEAFLTIPNSPLCYWIGESFINMLKIITPIGKIAEIGQGLSTAHNSRFIRFVWETILHTPHWIGWFPFEKGGGYARWFGNQFWSVDWRNEGSRIKQYLVETYPYLRGNYGFKVQSTHLYFKSGLVYSETVRGSLGVRLLEPGRIFDFKCPGIFLESGSLSGFMMGLNCRLTSFLVRAFSPSMEIAYKYLEEVPALVVRDSSGVSSKCLSLKRWCVSHDPREYCFAVQSIRNKMPDILSRVFLPNTWTAAALLHTLEGIAEQEVFREYGVSGKDLQVVLNETGTPAGSYPILEGFEEIPPGPEGLPDIRTDLIKHLSHHQKAALADNKLDDIQSRLRYLYEAGPTGSSEDEESAHNDGDEEEDQFTVGSRIPIPTETFLEELCQKLKIHPISVYWLLKEGIEREGWRCLPEERRLACERITVMILRLLGHRWPTQIEAGEPVPDWADADGIIPLTGGTGEPTLLERLRERIAADFDGDTHGSFERHFAEVMGKTLEQWLETEFFKYQISLLRKRPIAWQIQSGRYAKKRKPAFACLVYCHKLDGDLIPKIRAQYVGPLRQKWETELRGIEEVPDRSRSDRQDARLVELEELIAELKEFDERLKEVMDKGFGCGKLEALLAKERPDKWCSIDGVLPPPMDREVFLAQEGRYLPDLNDGVRVNIAPLQKAVLLAAEVLARKDVELAIADRAEWRSDERRWCREGKLPHPGWWQKGATDGTR